MHQREFIASENGKRLDACLAVFMDDQSRSFIQKLIEEGHVTVNGRMEKASYKVKAGDVLVVCVPDPQRLDVEAEEIPVEIVYEDDDIVVVNKPKGMVVHPGSGNYSGTLVNAMLSHCKESLSDINGVIRPGIVHRIDKDTTGILVIAKNNQAHEYLSNKLKDHDINRIYIGIADGVIYEETGRIEAPIGRHPVDRKKMAVNTKNGRHAVTHFKVLERFSHHTLLQFKLETGRTHQIRVHMAYIGHPLTGDPVYGRKKQPAGIDGQLLHAKTLGFTHPTTGQYVEFSANPPGYFEEFLKDLRNQQV